MRSPHDPAVVPGRSEPDFLVPFGRAKLRGIEPCGIVVVGERSRRCAVLTSAAQPELHRSLSTGLADLVMLARRYDGPPFPEAVIVDLVSRHLPPGMRLGHPARVALRDVCGTGRILFAEKVGGFALVEQFECRERRAAGPPLLGAIA